MTAGAATVEQAAMLVEQLRDTKQWWSSYPVPTVAMDESKFDRRAFWRGDMWPPCDYMVTQGLNRYGYHELARKLTNRMVELYERGPINERYDASQQVAHTTLEMRRA